MKHVPRAYLVSRSFEITSGLTFSPLAKANTGTCNGDAHAFTSAL